MQMKIDKSNWKKVKIIDVFTKKEENDKDNAKNRFDRFLKVNHMDAETLHIKRWGSQENGEELNPTFYKIFRKGQILFPTRNPHLRRTVLASFDGICGEKTLTLEPNEEFLIPEFIPFLFHSDSFYAHTTGAIIGSTNPHCRWRDVANYEFLLPPKEQQAQLAELLWAMDEVVEREKELYLCAETFFESNRNSIFSNIENDHNLNILKDVDFQESNIKNYYKVNSVNGIYKSKEFHGRGFRIVNMGELFAYPIIKDEQMALVELTDKEQKQFLVEEGDLIFARRSLVVEGAGRCSIIGSHLSPMTFESSMIRVRLDEQRILPKYVYHFLKSKLGRKRIRRIVGFTTVAGITSTDLAMVKTPIVSYTKQKQILDLLEQFEQVFLSINIKITTSKALQKSLINQVFSV